MSHSQDRTTRRESTGRSVTRVSIMLTLLATGALVIAAVSVLSRSVPTRPDSPIATEGLAERSNPRVIGRRPVANTSRLAPSARAMSLLVSVTVDTTLDNPLAAACTAAPADCSLRGAVAFANLNPGTTINVPAGTYQLNIPGGAVEGFNGDDTIGDLDITATDTSINGAGAATTIVQQTQPDDRVIEVNPFLDANFSFAMSGLTISGGHETQAVGGGGIISGSIDNAVTVTNCIFSGNSATGAGSVGGGGIAHTGGNLTVSGTTFSGNSSTSSGGAISYSAGDPFGRTPSAGTLSVSGSTFASNSSSSTAGGGGAMDLYNYNLGTGSYSVDSSSFSANNASSGSGGAINVESGPLTVTTSSFASNTAAQRGGAIDAGDNTSVTFSRLVGNSVTLPVNGLTLFRSGGTLTADDNWWGINTGPGTNHVRASAGTVSVTTWLQLRHSASPNEICSGASSTLTADIKGRNVGSPLSTELNGLPSFPVPPATIFTNPVLGALSGASTQFVNGAATATYTAGGTGGMGSADATADNQTVTATITISATSTTDPADQAVCQGATASFSTTAGGPGPISYAWTLDGSPFNGDSPSINVPTGSLSLGPHTVSVTTTGACGSASQSATLTVQEATATTGPADATVCQGATAIFATTASGTEPFSYAWTLDGSPFNGNSASINVPTGSLSVGPHTVSVTTTGACGSASQTATLTVQQATTTTDPADMTVCQGGTANFSTTASGTGPFHYAWTLDGSPFNGDSSSISVPTGSLSVGNHAVVVTTTGACSSDTQSGTLTVQENTATTDPSDQTVCQGATAAFSTTASGTAPFHYAWTLDGSPFGGDNATINVPTGSLSVGNHTVTVTTSGVCGSASQSASLTVQENTTTSDPSDQTVCQGATAAFSTTASGTGPLHYAWTLDGSPFDGDSPSINVPTGSLSFGNHTVGVTTSGACGSASQSATLTVQENTATSDPSDQTVCQGATTAFSTTASGTGPIHYAWTLDGSPFNGDSASINVPTGSLSVGSHTVAVTTSGTCGIASQSATLTVQENTATTDPADQTVCKGATANFSTSASGTGPFHYAWTLDGLPFNGDSPNISVPTGSLSSGPHTVAVTTSGTCGSASQSATLTVGSPPVITLSTSNINLWPPNHNYHTFNVSDFVASASGCDGDLTSSVVIASISSDELEDNPGGADGNTLNDIVIAANCKSAQLRAERDANLDGRVYTITFQVSDSQGNTTTATATVSVPLNQSGGSVVNGPGPGYTVASLCP